jgi:alpha-glucosidase
LLKAAYRTTDSSWINPVGKNRLVRDHYHELDLIFSETDFPGHTFGVSFRAYNDGVAFRYELPDQPGLTNFVLLNELTEFAFPANYPCFLGQQKGGFDGPQEFAWKQGHLADIGPKTITGLPLVVQASGAWLALTESDLLDWAGMWLAGQNEPHSSGTVLTVKLAPRNDGDGVVKSSFPRHSPWRVIMVGRQIERLMESDLVQNLASPSELKDTSWIKPGMMAWDHWWTGDVRMTTATEKQYIQLAADMGWPYQLVDWQWYGPFGKATSNITNANPDLDLPEVLRFAKEKNVRLWLWLYRGDAVRSNAYEKAFALYEQWGIAGVKIDGMGNDDQETVNWYATLARAAAQHHLMVDFHHACKPTGLERTLPNELTREGILGNEYDRSTNLVTPEHKVMLPFTRYLVGAGDFTPGGFLNRQPAQFKIDGHATEVQGTRAAELALFVVYFSPLTCACDSPEHYQGQPGIEFLKRVPTVWDETRVLSGQPGKEVVIARRSGADWYLGALTGCRPRKIPVRLDFLGKGKWTLQLWRDSVDAAKFPEHVDRVERTVTATDDLELNLAPAGGAVARFYPVQQ